MRPRIEQALAAGVARTPASRALLEVLRDLAAGDRVRRAEARQALEKREGKPISEATFAARLKRLEAAGVIARSERDTGGTGYLLTARGEALAHALGELMLWGLDLPDLYQPDDQSRAAWLAMNIQAALDRADTHPPAGTYAFHIGSERFWLRVADTQRTVLRDGTPPYPADATLTGSLGDLHAIVTGTAVDDSGATIDGDHERLAELLGLLVARVGR